MYILCAVWCTSELSVYGKKKVQGERNLSHPYCRGAAYVLESYRKDLHI